MRIREGCDCGSEVGTVHSGRDAKGSVSLRRPKVSGRRRNCKRFRLQVEWGVCLSFAKTGINRLGASAKKSVASV